MKYEGSKSLGAEIYVNFERGEVRMDYSSNYVHDPFESNTSVVTDSSNEWLNNPFWIKLPLLLIYSSKLLYLCCIAIEMFVVTLLMQQKLFPKQFQYPYQSFLRWFFTNFNGVFEESSGGNLKGTILKISIPKNIWFDYELSGDYENFIKEISFERRLKKFRKFNMYNLFVQDGWMLTFEFTESPQEGNCTVRYV